jgi:pimeloyl-ACP methyl ester carboxylesterase
VTDAGPAPFEIRVEDTTVTDLRARLAAARWAEPSRDSGWELGTNLGYARELCEHWGSEYDLSRLERLNELGSRSWDGLHFLRLGPDSSKQAPLVLLHGWPSGPIEYERVAPALAEAGREVIVPSLPGYAWSEDPGEPLNVAAMAARLRELLERGLGLERYAVAGGDWGAMLAARIAYDAPDRVAAIYLTTPHTIVMPGDLTQPPLSEAEGAWAERARNWRRRQGHHMVIQGLAPDAISEALTDSPAGLAAYLLDKYRTWSDSGGEIESRFSKDDLCDFLTMFWSTGTIASSMRLYYGEGRDRWRLQAGEAIEVPAGVALYPGEMRGGSADIGEGLNPPREWTQRVLPDLRRWSEMPRGGHFAAFEEPELYAADLIEFLDEVES